MKKNKSAGKDIRPEFISRKTKYRPKRLVVLVSLVSVFVFLLVVVAFLFIEACSHKSFEYDIFSGNEPIGKAFVDSFITEDKIVYRSTEKCPYTLDYPVLNQKLILKRNTLMPTEFSSETIGARGGRSIFLLNQKADKTDQLFMSTPAFFALKNFETGSNTVLFCPFDVMSYIPLMDLYNFWKMGTQFFEVMIPTGAPLPVMRDKIEIRSLGDDYMLFMGKRVEVERFLIKSNAVPESEIYLSRYGHTILSLKTKNRRYLLTEYRRKSFQGFGKKMFEHLKNSGFDIENISSYYGAKQAEPETSVTTLPKEVFFESGKLLLSGTLQMPEGEGPFPAVILVPGDGPLTNGEYFFMGSFAKSLASCNVAVLAFDSPGQGRSQGNFLEVDDERRIYDINSAITFLTSNTKIDKKRISLVGLGGGGFIALKTAENAPMVSSCILLGLPYSSFSSDTRTVTLESIQKILNEQGYSRFTEGYLNTVESLVKQEIIEINDPQNDLMFFMGKKIPVKFYREYIGRKPYEAMVTCEKPLLIICGKNDKESYSKAIEGLKSLLTQSGTGKLTTVNGLMRPYMGTWEKNGENWVFIPNEDLITLVRNWILGPR